MRLLFICALLVYGMSSSTLCEPLLSLDVANLDYEEL